MPERLRASFGLPFGEEERQSALRALRLIRGIYPVLPTRLRYVAPYHEALGRLGGRSRPDLMTRWLNCLWIGRECMADRRTRRIAPNDPYKAEDALGPLESRMELSVEDDAATSPSWLRQARGHCCSDGDWT